MNESDKKIKRFTYFLKTVNDKVEPKIKEVLELYVDGPAKSVINYQMEAGGKRLRPALALLSNLACGGKVQDVIYPAAGLEILHNCTLIYDDIIDNSLMRRKKPTVWSKFGRSIAECIGIDYSVAVFQSASKSQHPSQISDIFAKTMKTVVDGEIMDILFEQSGRKDEKYVNDNRYKEVALNDYLKMVNKKTAVLIQASCEIGAVSAKAKGPQLNALSDYGYNLGIAFQIRDDILDIFGHEDKSGKKVGTDIRERKLGNIVIFYALKELSDYKKEQIMNILKRRVIKDEHIKEAIEFIKQTKAQSKSVNLGNKYIEMAKGCLACLPDNKWKGILIDIADFVMEREK